MARRNIITRKVSSTQVYSMLCDTETGEIKHMYDTYVGKISEKKARKLSTEKYTKGDTVLVKVNLTEKSDKYVMDLHTFVSNAEVVSTTTE